jgi:hypothetical protein
VYLGEKSSRRPNNISKRLLIHRRYIKRVLDGLDERLVIATTVRCSVVLAQLFYLAIGQASHTLNVVDELGLELSLRDHAASKFVVVFQWIAYSYAFLVACDRYLIHCLLYRMLPLLKRGILLSLYRQFVQY